MVPESHSLNTSVWKHAQTDFEKANRLLEATDWTVVHNENQHKLSVGHVGDNALQTQHNLPWMNSHQSNNEERKRCVQENRMPIFMEQVHLTQETGCKTS